MAAPRICAIEGCDNPIHARGWCGKHNQRWRRHGDPEKLVEGRAQPGECLRFLDDVIMKHQGEDCIAWPFSQVSGYGQIWLDNRLWLVTRVVCERVHGPPPTPKHDAAHSCGKGHLGCASPHHLSWKTRAENVSDMVGHGTARRGSKNPLAHLTEDDVREIRRLRGKESQESLGRRFNVHGNTIGKIQLGRRWAWLA